MIQKAVQGLAGWRQLPLALVIRSALVLPIDARQLRRPGLRFHLRGALPMPLKRVAHNFFRTAMNIRSHPPKPEKTLGEHLVRQGAVPLPTFRLFPLLDSNVAMGRMSVLVQFLECDNEGASCYVVQAVSLRLYA